MLDENKTKETLKVTGEALFGSRWQTELANALGYKNARSIRQFSSGERKIPEDLWPKLSKIAKQKMHSLSLLDIYTLDRPVKSPANDTVALLQRTLSLNAGGDIELDPQAYFASKGAEFHCKMVISMAKSMESETTDFSKKEKLHAILEQLNILHEYEWLPAKDE